MNFMKVLVVSVLADFTKVFDSYGIIVYSSWLGQVVLRDIKLLQKIYM